MKVNKGESLLVNSDLSHQIQRSVDVHVLLCALKVIVIESNSAPKRSWSCQLIQKSVGTCVFHLSRYIPHIIHKYRYSVHVTQDSELQYLLLQRKTQGDSTFEGFNCFVTCLEVHPFHDDGCLRLLILLFLFTKADLRQFALKFG